jgi:cytochrome c nitrite reductase small subunit
MDQAASGGSAGARPRSGIPLWARASLALLFGGIVGLSLFTASYAEGTSYLSDDPAACKNCHVMTDVYDAWVRGPHHAVATCNDCHIPHSFPAKYIVKAQNGWNHSLAFTLENFPEPIRITPSNKQVALANCLECHGDFVSLVNHEGQEELEDCTRCHASIGHDEIGAGKP